jgi:hypothetical protein
VPAMLGVIIANGTSMPCTIKPQHDGKFYP